MRVEAVRRLSIASGSSWPQGLREVVGRTLEDHRAVFAAHGIRLEDRRPARPIRIHGDASRLSQVLGNVLHNALKFTPEGGEVRVSLEADEGQAVLRVRDNGAGIPPDLLGRIFEPFTQAEQSLDRSVGGLGLGRDRALAAGFDRHLIKPPSVDELERVLGESGAR